MLILLISCALLVQTPQQIPKNQIVELPGYHQTYLQVAPNYFGPEARLASAIVYPGSSPKVRLAGDKLTFVKTVPAALANDIQQYSPAGFKVPMKVPTEPGDYELVVAPIDLTNMQQFYDQWQTTQPTQVYRDPKLNQDYFVMLWLKSTALPNCSAMEEGILPTLLEDLDYKDVDSLATAAEYMKCIGLIEGPRIGVTALIDILKTKASGASSTAQAFCALMRNSLGDRYSLPQAAAQFGKSSLLYPEVWDRPLVAHLVSPYFVTFSPVGAATNGYHFGGQAWCDQLISLAVETKSSAIRSFLICMADQYWFKPNLVDIKKLIEEMRTPKEAHYVGDFCGLMEQMLPKSNPLQLPANPMDPHWANPEFRKHCLDAWERVIEKLQTEASKGENIPVPSGYKS